MQISPIQQNNTSFGTSLNIPDLNPKYTTRESKQSTVAILGSSASSELQKNTLKQVLILLVILLKMAIMWFMAVEVKALWARFINLLKPIQ